MHIFWNFFYNIFDLCILLSNLHNLKQVKEVTLKKKLTFND